MIEVVERGIILEIDGRDAVVLTRDGDFRRVRLDRPGRQVGEEIVLPARRRLPAGLVTVAAVAAADTPTLRRLHVSRTTFDSFFPYLPGTARRMGRDALWLILLLNSEKGIARTLQRRPIDPGRYRGLACAEPPRRRGPLMLWTDCRVRRARPGGGEDTVRLFGSLVHWQGRWRFLSYANDF